MKVCCRSHLNRQFGPSGGSFIFARSYKEKKVPSFFLQNPDHDNSSLGPARFGSMHHSPENKFIILDRFVVYSENGMRHVFIAFSLPP
jgi:hypothetical protein